MPPHGLHVDRSTTPFDPRPVQSDEPDFCAVSPDVEPARRRTGGGGVTSDVSPADVVTSVASDSIGALSHWRRRRCVTVTHAPARRVHMADVELHAAAAGELFVPRSRGSGLCELHPATNGNECRAPVTTRGLF